MTNQNNAELSELCISCGLCCSGAIFSHAKLSQEDKATLRTHGIAEGNAALAPDRLLLPCPLLEGTRCSVYGKGRPKICGEYLCKLVRQLDSGELSLDEAKQVTARARDLYETALAGLPDGGNIATGAKQLLDGERAEQVSAAAFDRARLAYISLQVLIDRQFRTADQRWVKSSAME